MLAAPEPAPEKTDITDFTGTWLADEIASLLSLLLGTRLMAGSATRHKFAENPDWLVQGDTNRPVGLFPRRPGYAVVPRAVERKNLAHVCGLFSTLPSLQPGVAIEIVRAARAYRDALWIAEAHPELAWLLFVSALEIAAVQQLLADEAPLDVLRTVEPSLAEDLGELPPDRLHRVAEYLAPKMIATKRFVEFVVRFMPDAPNRRPPEAYRLDWTPETMRKCAKVIYDHRSNALHGGIPFPPPMCRRPEMWEASWKAPAEKIQGYNRAVLGGVWHQRHLPFPLHTFEYVARGCLRSWWQYLAVAAVLPRVESKGGA